MLYVPVECRLTVDGDAFFTTNEQQCSRSDGADMAQSVERVLGKDEVTGSNPVISSNKTL